MNQNFDANEPKTKLISSINGCGALCGSAADKTRVQGLT
jgi:hypothetical protein